MNNIKFYPNSIDIELVNSKNLNDNYVILQNKYRHALEDYIMKICDIRKYELRMEDSGIRFSKLEEDAQSIYQKWCTWNLNYIYLRNNVHIEKLDFQDLQILQNYDIGSNELFDLVKRTYKEVIKVNVIDGKKIDGTFKVNYINGFNNRESFADNDALVIVIREAFERYNVEGKELGTLVLKKMEFIDNLKKIMKEEMEVILNTKVHIISIVK